MKLANAHSQITYTIIVLIFLSFSPPINLQNNFLFEIHDLHFVKYYTEILLRALLRCNDTVLLTIIQDLSYKHSKQPFLGIYKH